MKLGGFAVLLLVTLTTRAVQSSNGTRSSHGTDSLHFNWPIFKVLQHLAKVDNECGVQAKATLKDLKSFSYHAVRMMDASGKLPSGILSGSSYDFGDFDSCMSLLPRVQYCLTSLTLRVPGEPLSSPRFISEAATVPSQNTSAFHYMQRGGERWRLPRDEIRIGLCVPLTCSPETVQGALATSLGPLLGRLGLGLRQEQEQAICTRGETIKVDAPEVIYYIIVAVLTTTCFLATIYDIYSTKENPSFSRRFFLSFSSKRHLLGLVFSKANQGHQSQMVDVLRFLSLVVIIMSHKMEYTIIGPMRNPEFVEKSYSTLWLMPMLNPSLVVDAFFFLGGLALASKILSQERHKKREAIWKLYLLRYIRLTPPYLLVMMFTATALPRMATGPLWDTLVLPESQYCRQNWWTNALYLNNYIKPEEMCLMHSWYLPCDMHFYILSVPVIFLLIRKPRTGIFTLMAIFALSMVLPLITIYAKDTDAFMLVFYDFLRADRNFPYFANIYVKSHLRATPYLAGVITAFIQMKVRKTPMKKLFGAITLLLGITIFVITSVSGVAFYEPNSWISKSRLARAVYGATHRAIWGAALCACVVGIQVLTRKTHKDGESSEEATSVRLKFPLGPLCYSAYLVHVAVITYSGASVRHPVYSNELLLGIRSFGDTMVTFVIALFTYINVEAPAREIGRLLLQSQPPKSEQKTSDVEFVDNSGGAVLTIYDRKMDTMIL